MCVIEVRCFCSASMVASNFCACYPIQRRGGSKECIHLPVGLSQCVHAHGHANLKQVVVKDFAWFSAGVCVCVCVCVCVHSV